MSHDGGNVTKEKDLCQPFEPDHRVFLCIQEPDEPSKDHIDGGGEEGRTQQQEESLDEVRTLGPLPGLLTCIDSSGRISDRFNYIWSIQEPLAKRVFYLLAQPTTNGMKYHDLNLMT